MSDIIDDDVRAVATRPRPRPRKRVQSNAGPSTTTPTTSIVAPTSGESSMAATIIHELVEPAVKVIPSMNEAPVIDYFAHRQKEALMRARRAESEERLKSLHHIVEQDLRKRKTSIDGDVTYKKTRTCAGTAMPASGWKGKEKATVVIEVGSSDIDDDVVLIEERNQARMPSLTPPPELDARALHMATAAVRVVQDSYNPLLNGPLSRYNYNDDDIADLLSTENGTSTLPAAVQEMLAEKTRQALRAKERSSINASGEMGDANIADSEAEAGPEIRLTVQTHVDPEEVRAASMSANAVAARQKKKVFPIRLRSPLDPIFEELCDSMKVSREKLVMSYNGSKIYGGSLTPMQLGIGSDVTIDAYSSLGWQKLQEREQTTRRERMAALWETDDQAGASTATPVVVTDEEVTGGASTDKITIRLMGPQDKEPVRTQVKPTTRMVSLLEYYARKRNVDIVKLSISLDGETLGRDSTVGDADLEDDDQLDVRVV